MMVVDVSWMAIRLAVCLLASMPLFAGAASAADPATGERIAARWCASCHAIGRGQPRTRTEAASFAEVARVPEFDARLLAFFLLDPHPKMPDMSLTRTEAADLAAYILSLKN
jgi:mono/diheme cytochrome c family protein